MSFIDFFGDVFNVVSIFVHIVCIELGSTGFRIDTCKFNHIESTVWFSYFTNLRTALDFRLHAIQGYNFILVMRNIECCIPWEILSMDVGWADFQFHTFILYFTDVHQVTAETGSHRDRTVHQQVLGGTGVILQSNVNTIPKCEVQAQIQVIVCLPLQVVIPELRLNDARLFQITVSQTAQSHISEVIGRKGTIHTIRRANL